MISGRFDRKAATAIALAQWRSMRSGRVSSPCKVRNELNGEAAEPRSRNKGGARLDDVGHRADRLDGFSPHRAMIGRVGRVERRLAFGKLLPVKIAAVDQRAADGRTMAADEFGRGIDDDRGAVVEGTAQDGRGGIVHDQRNADLPADGRDFRDGEHGELGIGQGFRIIGAGAGVGGASKIFGIGGIDEPDLDPLVLQRVGEQVPGAAIKVGRGHDVVARLGEVLDGKRGRRLSG